MYIIIAILAFSVLVLIHELGHFVMAKANGIMVEEFSIGMGPKLYSIKGKETTYSIRAFPIGGFVKMLGDQDKSSDPRAFNSKSPLRKLSVVVAGPVMNIILAVILYAIVAGNIGFQLPIVSELVKDGAAFSAGIKQGDEIVKINNSKVYTWDDFVLGVTLAKDKESDITILRNGTTKVISVKPAFDKETKRYLIGVQSKVVNKPTIVQAISYGFKETISMTKQAFAGLKMMLSGKASGADIAGPVSIIKITGAAAKSGFIYLVMFTAYLSSQLGILNLMPFPALDGGHIILFIFQIITGKEIDDNKVGIINTIGFAMLMTLMVVVTIKDILYPIKF